MPSTSNRTRVSGNSRSSKPFTVIAIVTRWIIDPQLTPQQLTYNLGQYTPRLKKRATGRLRLIAAAMREDLIQSAVQFLIDPAVQKAALAKRVSFLESKNMTQEEIEESLRRANSPGSQPPPLPSSPLYRTQFANQQQQQQPPQLPGRDWRDWFIMAVVSGGIGYGMYFLAKRYVMPLIAPPAPPQIEQDKAEIGEQYDRLNAVLEQLQIESNELKTTQEEQKTRVEGALTSVDEAVTELKGQTERRESDIRSFKSDIEAIREMVPKVLNPATKIYSRLNLLKAFEKNKESQNAALVDLQNELKSLKSLLSNRSRLPPAIPLPTSGSSSPIPNHSFIQPTASPPPAAPSIAATEHLTMNGTARNLGKPSIPAWQLPPQLSDGEAADAST